MGRITMFTTDGCPHCKRVKVALLSRDIPFVDISITQYPKRRADMMALSDRVSTPQVFFNTRHVGGADETIALLAAWDDANNKSKYSTPRERYEFEIGRQFDPSNPRLAIPTTDYDGNQDVDGDLIDGPVLAEESLAAKRGQVGVTITLPDGKQVTSLQVTELMKKILPCQDNIRKFTRHKKSFTGQEAVATWCQHFGNTNREQAMALGTQLLEKQIMLRIVRSNHNSKDELAKKPFDDSSDALYRLQCFVTPDILNSYRIWTESIMGPPVDPMRLVHRLRNIMNKIESIQTNDQAEIDYGEAVGLPLFTVFEEAVCELQLVNLACMDDKTKTAFGINLYNLMIKYAFMKVGAGSTDYNRYVFYNSVKFYVGKYQFSFQDWENGILRGNRKAPYAFSLQFDKKDPRLELIVQKPDPRLHFALNCGARSCPPVNCYTVETLEEDLSLAAQSFCESDAHVRLDTTRNELHLSTIFNWYKVDFARNTKELPVAILQYLRRVKQQELERLLDEGTKIRVVFDPYDWSMNAHNVKTFDSSEFNMDTRTIKQTTRSRSIT